MAALTFRSQGWRLQRSCVVPVSDVESLRTAVSVSQDDPSDQQELIGKMTQPGTRAVPMPGAPSGRSEKVHRAFLVRLRNDRVRLTLLAAELTRGAGTAHAFENIRLFAHEVRGDAAAFDAAEVDIAAHALELAAGAAPMSDRRNSPMIAAAGRTQQRTGSGTRNRPRPGGGTWRHDRGQE
jgi:hypothetical protein